MGKEKNRDVRKKAELLCTGRIYIPEDILSSCETSKSTAGPGAGVEEIALGFRNARVKLVLADKKSAEFSLKKIGSELCILKNGSVFIRGAKILPKVLHAPFQAFVNLEHRCIYDCKFCTSAKLDRSARSADEVVDMVLGASKKEAFGSVAITSGVRASPKKAVDEMVAVVKKIRKAIDAPIGVEPYIVNRSDIVRLKEAGADEIKINIQSYDRKIFKKVCPKLSYEKILERLSDAVEIFGRGKVTSNIIIGLGETDENILSGSEHLAKEGVVVTLRALRITDCNRPSLVEALGELKPVTPERLIFLAKEQKKILEKYNLSTLTFDTMCHACGCCDIVPFVDL